MLIVQFLLAWLPEIISVLTAIVLVAVLRWPILWYFGIIETHRNQEETNKLLRIIANQNRTKSPLP